MGRPPGRTAWPRSKVRRFILKKAIRFSLAALLAAVLVLPVRAAEAAFEDVPQDYWAAEEIQYVTERRLFNGVSATRFDPLSNLDWAMLSTVLYRYAGSPGTAGPSPYTDVPEGQWYTDGIIWAYENRILPARSLNSFQLGTQDEVRRAEFCIMLYNFARWLGEPVPDSFSPLPDSSFTDMSWISFARMGYGAVYGEAETAMLRWAVPLGIMNGISDTSLDPLGRITRAEAAAMISRFDQIVLGGTEPPADPEPAETPPIPTETDPGQPGAGDPTALPEPGVQLLPVQLIMQNPELPNGCEATSLAMLLSCTGIPADKMDVLIHYLPTEPFTWRDGVRYGPDPQTAYAGDASVKGGGWYCFENPVIAAGNVWLRTKDCPYQMKNCTGLTREELEQYLGQGTPMVVWATLKCQTPHFSTSPWTLPDGSKYYPYTNLHCFVLTGLTDDQYDAADPIYGWQSLSPAAFWQVFDAMGRRAVTLAPAPG